MLFFTIDTKHFNVSTVQDSKAISQPPLLPSVAFPPAMLILSSSETELASGDRSAMEIDVWEPDKVMEDGIVSTSSVNGEGVSVLTRILT